MRDARGTRASVSRARYRTTPLALTASYTFSSAEDMLNHWFSPENSVDPESDRGPTGASTPHNLVTSVSWSLPGSGPIVGGWRLSAVTHSQSGSPYTIRYAGDPVGYGAGVGRPATRAAASRARRAAATPRAACSSTTPT